MVSVRTLQSEIAGSDPQYSSFLPFFPSNTFPIQVMTMLCQLFQFHELFMNTHSISVNVIIDTEAYRYIYIVDVIICVVIHADHILFQ